jgi:hypothetical protein
VTVADGKGKYRGDFTLHYQDPEASWDGAPITESTEGSGDGIVPVELEVDLTGGVGGSYTVSLAYPSEQIDQKIIGTQADTYCSTRYGTCNTTTQSVFMPHSPGAPPGLLPLTGTLTDPDHIKGSWMWSGGDEASSFGKVQNVVTIDLWRMP